ncbi:unnamed protein product [Rotaria socialis]|uniref:oleoyl-[acyl-carrier-protein] hydrolase n=1 Tax=Rotaria socialis TaxID=392032 RepID=A0A818JV08_9BILA|nr:unnamed protein product [Rotaria socialis]
MSPILYCSICLGFILCYSIATKIDVEGQSSLINRYDERSITSDKRNNIFNSPFHGLLKKTKNENNIRRRRDETHNVDMKAVVAKLEDHRTMINDHRTMIDDHRTMINNFNNNSIHVDTIQQAISKHHSSAPPFEAASSTRSSNSGKDRRWYLTDGIVGDERAERAFGDDVIAVNGLCMKGQMRFNITSRLTSDRTTQLANSLKSKLEDIIRDRFSAKPPIEIDYSNDFEQPFVLLNADSDNILFILPPGDGGAESYFNNIVPHLSSYKLVIFNNYYYNLKEKNMKKGASFEALARLYIKYIKLIQLNGPYNFLGWSFGGVLSFEIARQLNNAGDPVANILMIDSYFNMSKAYLEIGKMNSVDEVNQISYSYLPQIDNEAFGLNIANMNIKIVLFKANLVKEGYLLNDQLEFFKYYINTTFNCLDTLVNHKYIQLFQMYDDSHFSWVSNKEQIVKICNYVASILK